MKRMFDLTGKVALVTGGNGGIGLGMARGLASHGASIVVAGRSAAESAMAVRELQGLGATASGITVDVKDETSVNARGMSTAPFGALLAIRPNAVEYPR